MRLLQLIAVLLTSAAAGQAFDNIERPNVLFIAIDDLNDWVGHLGGHPQGATPNIDALANRGVTFTNAHCAAPACNPSRAALMSGMRPYSSGVYVNAANWKEALGDVLTMNEHFMAQGYDVLGGGKIYHGSTGIEGKWTEYWKRPGDAKTEPNKNGLNMKHFDWGPIDCDDDGMGDHALVSWAIDELNEEREKPLFLAVGFVKPHLPFYAPKKYFDRFPLESLQLPKVKGDDLDDLPPAGLKMARPDGDHAKVTSKELEWKLAVQAYLATIAFVDHEVGRLIEGLDKSPNGKETIVVLWGDHGWHLGEKQHWRKFALWNDATRVPYIIHAPGVSKAGICNAPVDLLSIYPTLCELTGVAAPKHLEGANLRPLLEDPKADWQLPAISTHGRENHMVQTRHHRYIRYEDGSEELYDHRDDPHEWKNLASNEDSEPLMDELMKHLPKKEVEPEANDTARLESKRKKN